MREERSSCRVCVLFPWLHGLLSSCPCPGGGRQGGGKSITMPRMLFIRKAKQGGGRDGQGQLLVSALRLCQVHSPLQEIRKTTKREALPKLKSNHNQEMDEAAHTMLAPQCALVIILAHFFEPIRSLLLRLKILLLLFLLLIIFLLLVD